MIDQLQSAIFWARSLWAMENNDVFKTRIMFDNFSRRRKNIRPYHQAFEAKILILEGKYEQALSQFYRLSNYMKYEKGNPDDLYVYLYSQYFIAIIEEKQESDDIRIRARAIDISRNIRRALPLPAESIDVSVAEATTHKLNGRQLFTRVVTWQSCSGLTPHMTVTMPYPSDPARSESAPVAATPRHPHSPPN